MARRLNIGNMYEIFEMSDDEDIYINLAAEKFEKEKLFDQKEDDLIIAACVEYEEKSKQIPKKMFLIDSQSLIKKKHLLAKIKLRNKKIGDQNMSYISEYFHYVEEWPAYAIEILFGKEFYYEDRMKLAAFFVGNGLIYSSIALNIFKIYNPYWSGTVLWWKRFELFEKLFPYFEKPFGDPDRASIRGKYFYYDILTETTRYLNGLKKK